jgi:hypothetical protein
MGKKRSFKVGNEVLDIPIEEVDKFLVDIPDAQEVKSYVVEKDTLDIPINEVPDFEASFKEAKPLNAEPFDATTQPQQQEAGLDTFIPPVIGSRDPLNPNENSSFNPPPTAPEPPQQIEVTRKQRDAIIGSALKVPKDIRSNSVFGTRYVKDVSKRTGIPEQAVKQLYEQGVKNEDAYVEIKTQYDITPEDSPDKNQQLNVMGQLLLDLGRYDEAAQAYKQLETRLYKEGLQELKPGMRPDYLDQKQAPAFIGLMNAVYSKGDMKEYERMLKIAEMKGIDLSGQPSVGDGSYMQDDGQVPSTFGFSGKKGTDTTPTPESQYLNEIANTVERLTPGVNTMKMMGHGIDKVAKNQWEFNNYAEYQLNMITGLVEAAGAVAMMATPSGAVAGVPFEQLPNYIPESVSEYMMPVSKLVRYIYDDKPPVTAENLSILADFALMALVAGGAHGVKNAQGKRIARGEVGKELIKNIESLPPDELRAMFEQAEKRFEATGSDPVLYAEQVKERATQVASKLKEVEESLPMEPYNPEPAPESLRTVKEGVDVEFEGKIGKLDRGDDGAWYFVDEEGKSTQIPVEDKFNPTEKLSELGIQVLPEISKESVARAVADREQVGDVEYKDKKYFVSLDNPMSESPTGDLVFERSADGRLLNRFDSHPDPAFASSRKLAIINKYLADKGLPPRKKLIEPWKEKSAPVSTEKTSEGAVTPKEVVKERAVEAPPIEVVETTLTETQSKFKQASDLWSQINETQGGSKKRRLAEQRRKLLDENPSVKRIEDNISKITKQLEDKGLLKKRGNCP